MDHFNQLEKDLSVVICESKFLEENFEEKDP